MDVILVALCMECVDHDEAAATWLYEWRVLLFSKLRSKSEKWGLDILHGLEGMSAVHYKKKVEHIGLRKLTIWKAH